MNWYEVLSGSITYTSIMELGQSSDDGGLVCRFVGHAWEATDMRVTHGRVVCRRCDAAEWRQN